MPIPPFQAAVDRPLHRQQITVDDVAAFERAADDEMKVNGAVDPAVVERLAQQYRRFVAGDAQSVKLDAPVVDRLSALLVRLGAVVPTTIERRVLARDFPEKTPSGASPYQAMYEGILGDRAKFDEGFAVVQRAVQAGTMLGDDWSGLMHRAAQVPGGAAFIDALASLGVRAGSAWGEMRKRDATLFVNPLDAALARKDGTYDTAWPPVYGSAADARASVDALLRAGANPNVEPGRAAPLHLVARWKDDHGEAVAIARALLEAGADPNARARSYAFLPMRASFVYGDSPLSIARRAGNTELVDLLLAHGAKDHSLVDEEAAVRARTAADVKTILARGACDPTWVWARVLDSNNLLKVAPDQSLLLLQGGLDGNVRVPLINPERSRLLLHVMADRGTQAPGLLKELAKQGVDMDLVDDDGRTALLRTVEPRIRQERTDPMRFPIVDALIEGGADPNRPGPDGDRPLHVARRARVAGMIPYLVKRGASLEALNAAGYTPLGQALLDGDLWGVRALLDAGADPNTSTPNDGPAWAAALRRFARDASLSAERRDILRALLDSDALRFDAADVFVKSALDDARAHPILRDFVDLFLQKAR